MRLPEVKRFLKFNSPPSAATQLRTTEWNCPKATLTASEQEPRATALILNHRCKNGKSDRRSVDQAALTDARHQGLAAPCSMKTD